MLIAKLLEIERAVVQRNDPSKIRAMVLEAQGSVLELEQQLIETMGELQRLRERMENCERSRLTGVSTPKLSKNEEMAGELAWPVGTGKSGRIRRFFLDTGTESIN